ncbi:hypothetical protein SPONL_1722 [uncultured Candidatus Thioglobus sp.]|nr:hypothetical protein SPONL_1722 [uncultured Candidatus Thioglobus sp.]
MKKIITIALLTLTVSANAFWNSNNTPWGNGYNNNYGNYGSQDNGFFAFNPFDYWDPRWYPEEMSNMIDEFDNNWGGNNQNGYNSNGYRYNPYNRTTWNGKIPASGFGN